MKANPKRSESAASHVLRANSFRSLARPHWQAPRTGLQIAAINLIAVVLCCWAGTARANDETLTIAFAAEATQVDPTRTTAGVDDYFMNLFFERLLATNPELEHVNWLAEHWEMIEEGDRIRIDVKLREGVKFHNGDEMTAHDFRFAYDRMREPTSGVAVYVRYITDVEIHDDYRISLHLSQPDPTVVNSNMYIWAIPKNYFESVGDEGFQKHPVGTGPWKFVSRRPRDELVVERFDDYWNKDVMPGYKRLIIKIIPEDTTRVAAYKTGAVDWIDAVPPAQVKEFQSLPSTRVINLQAGNNLYINLNAIDRKSPFRDPRVRLAVAHAVDFDAIIEYVLFGQGIRTPQLAPGSLGYDPELKAHPYDPQKARELLKEAGYPDGIAINCYNLTTPREPYFKEVGETIYAYLAESGINCRIEQMEYGAWINAGRYNARPWMDGLQPTMWGHGLPGDPTVAWGGHMHSNGDGWGAYSYHSDSDIDRRVEELRRLMDEDERAEKIRELALLKHSLAAGGIPTYRPVITFAWRDTVSFNPWPGAYWRSMRQIRPCPSKDCRSTMKGD
ncbi:MAG: ABC transporter substrate-binding protein [Pseudomonadales bacterium]|nr:ABC transporter substrate-binding protein [Pseudomonadales bacterium]